MKFKLQKDKYFYRGERLSVPEDIKKYLFKFILVESLSLSLFISNTMGGAITKEWNTLFLNNKYSFDGLKDSFAVMDVQDKTSQIINSFYCGLDDNSYLADEQKQYLKEVFTPYLEDYGYLYDYDGLVNMQVTLSCVGLKYDNIENDSEYFKTTGYYQSGINNIVLDNDSGYGTLSHEILHSITIDDVDNVLPNFVLEGVNSSFDETYAGCSSYFSLLKSQVAMVSEIMGREEFMRCFVNADGSSFKNFFEQLDKDAYNRLCELTDEELIFMKRDGIYDNDKIIEIAEILRSMYEKVHGKGVEQDAIVNLLYNTCLSNYTCYSLKSTMFYDDDFVFDLYDKYNDVNITNNVINVCDRDVITINDAVNLNFIAKSRLSAADMNGDKRIILKLFFTEERASEIMAADDIVDYLIEYFKKRGIENYGSLINTVLCGDGYGKGDIYNINDLCYIYLEKYNYNLENGQLCYAAADLNSLASEFCGLARYSEGINNLFSQMAYLTGNTSFQDFSGFYWGIRNTDSYDDSVLCYWGRSYVDENNDACIRVINCGIQYDFFLDEEQIWPESIEYDYENGTVDYYFPEYFGNWICVVGNQEEKRNYELEIESNDIGKSR